MLLFFATFVALCFESLATFPLSRHDCSLMKPRYLFRGLRLVQFESIVVTRNFEFCRIALCAEKMPSKQSNDSKNENDRRFF